MQGIVIAHTATLRCPCFVSAGAMKSTTSARPDSAMYQRGTPTRSASSSRCLAARVDAAADMPGKYLRLRGCQAASASSVLQPLVRRQCEEVDELLAQCHLVEQLARLVGAALRVEELVAHLLADLLELLVLVPPDEL